MERRGAPLLLIPLLALVAGLYPLTSSRKEATRMPSPQKVRSPERRAEKSGPSYPKNKEAQTYTAKRIIGEFLSALELPDKGWPEGDPRRNYEIKFLIATVPDPIDSRLPYFFDRFLGSIQRAAEGADYVLDSFHLPWVKPEAETSKETAELFREIMIRLEQEAGGKATDSQETQPGFVLFRKPFGRELLLVFLVGETPTTGIHKAALREALDQVAWFCGWPNDQPDPLSPYLAQLRKSCNPIRVLCPTFTGSADSLTFALRDWLHQFDPEFGGRSSRLNKRLGRDRAVRFVERNHAPRAGQQLFEDVQALWRQVE